MSPYIRQQRRGEITDGFVPETAGELNFAITDILDSWLCEEKLSYDRLNAAIGVLECAKQELYRRIVAEYEDNKRADHGDVYTYGWEDV